MRQTLNSLSKELNPAEWEKFNTELKRVEQRMKEVKAGGKSVDNTFGILNSKMVKITGWFAIIKQGIGILVGLGSNVFKTFAKETQLAGDKIEATFTGIKFSFSSMIRSVTTGDWSGLFRNMALAYEHGKRFKEIMDEVFELQNSQNIQEVKLSIKITIVYKLFTIM